MKAGECHWGRHIASLTKFEVLLLRKGRLDICTQLAVSSTVPEIIIAVLSVCKEVQQDLMLTVIMCSLNCTEKLNIHRFAFII